MQRFVFILIVLHLATFIHGQPCRISNLNCASVSQPSIAESNFVVQQFTPAISGFLSSISFSVRISGPVASESLFEIASKIGETPDSRSTMFQASPIKSDFVNSTNSLLMWNFTVSATNGPVNFNAGASYWLLFSAANNVDWLLAPSVSSCADSGSASSVWKSHTLKSGSWTESSDTVALFNLEIGVSCPPVSPSTSPSASVTPSITPSQSVSASPSVSASFSPSTSTTASGSTSTSPSESPSQSASVSPSTSNTASISPSKSSSQTVSPSPSGSDTPSITPSNSGSTSTSASPSVSPSESASVTQSPSPGASLSPSTSTSSSGSVSPSSSLSPSVSLTASISASSSITPSTSPSASISASHSPSGSDSPSTSITPSITASSSIVPSTSPSASIAATLSPSSSPPAQPNTAIITTQPNGVMSYPPCTIEYIDDYWLSQAESMKADGDPYIFSVVAFDIYTNGAGVHFPPYNAGITGGLSTVAAGSGVSLRSMSGALAAAYSITSCTSQGVNIPLNATTSVTVQFTFDNGFASYTTQEGTTVVAAYPATPNPNNLLRHVEFFANNFGPDQYINLFPSVRYCTTGS